MTPYLRANDLGLRDLANACGYGAGIERAWSRGDLSFDQADALLCKVGAFNAWRDNKKLKVLYLEADLSKPGQPPRFSERKRCAAKGCSVYFKPRARWHRYCSQACGQRARHQKSGRYGSRYDTCPAGHDRSPENVRERGDGTIACRACGRERERERYQRDEAHRERRIAAARSQRAALAAA